MRTTLLKFVLLFSLVLLNTSLSTGQIQYNNIRFKQLSIAEGLPHNTINAITQDNHGFIWFGTRNGLCRYDGYNINLFAHNEADSTSLRHNFITRLYNDSLRNILWISTDQGICSYNYETEDFSRYQIKGNTKDDVCFLNTSDGVLPCGGRRQNLMDRHQQRTDAIQSGEETVRFPPDSHPAFYTAMQQCRPDLVQPAFI